MLKIKSIRKKNPPTGYKWEVTTTDNDYAIIRYKDGYLDVRIAESENEFILGGGRTLYRDKIELRFESDYLLCFMEVMGILGVEFSENGFYYL